MQENYEAEMQHMKEKLKKELRLTLIVVPLIILLSVALTRIFGIEEMLARKIVAGVLAVILVLYAARKAKIERERSLAAEKKEGEDGQ